MDKRIGRKKSEPLYHSTELNDEAFVSETLNVRSQWKTRNPLLEFLGKYQQ